MMIGDDISRYAVLAARRAQASAPDSYVRFLGYIPEETLAAMYRLASVFVFPSLYEGFGLPPLEAMASGTPVVTSNVSSLPEVAGDAAVLVDPLDPEMIGDAIYRVLTDDGLRCDLRQKGLARARPVLVGTVGCSACARSTTRSPRVDSPDRSRSRLAHRHARRRNALSKCSPSVSPTRRSSRLVHVRGSVAPAIERLPSAHLVRCSTCRSSSATTAITCRSSRRRSSDSISSGFDVVLSVSHCCAKSVIKAPSARHICYCLTPMRYAWDQFDAYFGPDRIGWLGSRLMRPVMNRMARWDRDTAGRADRYVAISHYVAGRIARYYNREAIVVYPRSTPHSSLPMGRLPNHSR